MDLESKGAAAVGAGAGLEAEGAVAGFVSVTGFA